MPTERKLISILLTIPNIEFDQDTNCDQMSVLALKSWVWCSECNGADMNTKSSSNPELDSTKKKAASKWENQIFEDRYSSDDEDLMGKRSYHELCASR